MINLKTGCTIAVLATISSIVVGCSSLTSWSPRVAPASTRNVEVAITSIKVVEAEEDRSLLGVLPLSDGDEPYVVVVGFKSTFGSSERTQVFRGELDYKNDSKNALRAGGEKPVSAKMGALRFPDVSSNDLIGVIVIAMERDRTPTSIIDEAIAEANIRLDRAAEYSVESQGFKSFNSMSVVNELHRNMGYAAAALDRANTAGKAFEEIFFSGGDTDEVIGMNSLLIFAKPPIPEIYYPQYNDITYTDVFRGGAKTHTLVFENREEKAKYEGMLRIREY